MRRLIRRFAIWLNANTELWVIPSRYWGWFDRNDARAPLLLDLCEQDWPNDPHIAYARGMESFLDVQTLLDPVPNDQRGWIDLRDDNESEHNFFHEPTETFSDMESWEELRNEQYPESSNWTQVPI